VDAPALLFVDDDAFGCYGYTELLRLDGWAAASCDFSSAAVAAGVVSRPVIVVVHLWLPDPRSLETVLELSRLSAVERPVIVALTARASETLARAAECDAVILKPIDALSFVGAIHDLYAALVGGPTDRVGRLRLGPRMEALMADGGPVRVFRGVHQGVGSVQESVHGSAGERTLRRAQSRMYPR
jgi:DNA-binding response OmpR family regulator